MKKNPVSKKQGAFLRGKDKRITLLTGSVRSGKTWVSLLKWGLYVGSTPSNCEFIMCGKTLTSLKRNCLNLLSELVGDNNFSYSISQKSAVLFGRRVWLEGANDERAESKIRGMTLSGAYCDELTLFPQGFYTMLLSRLSVKGARLYATTNPDSPSHWVKTDIIDNKDITEQFTHWRFTLEDNDFNDPDYVEYLKKEYISSPTAYSRYILGDWVRAEGIIYRSFADNPRRYYTDKPPPLMQVNIGMDFGGTHSKHSLVATGITPGYKKLVALRSERMDAEGTTPDDVDKFAVKFVGSVIREFGRCDYLYYDNAEQVLGRGVRRAIEKAYPTVSVRECFKAEINERISLMTRLLGLDMFAYTQGCQTLVSALCEAVWDEKKEDTRLDDGSTDIDTLDALEYSFTRNMTRFIF